MNSGASCCGKRGISVLRLRPGLTCGAVVAGVAIAQILIHLRHATTTRPVPPQGCNDNLSQSILAKAFQGELVPTEAKLAEGEGRSFESAEELLKRIKGFQLLRS